MKRTIPVALWLVVGATGCTTALPVCEEPKEIPWEAPEMKFVRVDFAMESEGILDSTAEISQTPAYRRQISSIRSVAIRAPNECLDRSAREQTGEDRENEVILQTTCSIYLKELEQGLARVGYRVVSWDVLDRTERKGNVSTYEAAADLGADAVFIVNSLETPQTDAGEEAEFRFNYFRSNPRGEVVAPLALTEEEQGAFVQRVLVRTPGLATSQENLKVLVATLDTTAVAVPSGESIWFYRRSLAEFSDEELSATFYRKYLFASLDGDQYWGVWPAGVPKPRAKTAPEKATSSSSTSFSFKKKGDTTATEIYRKRQQAMLRKIVDEFAEKFAKGATQ